MWQLINIEWAKFGKHKTLRTLGLLYMLFLPALLMIPGSLPGVEKQLGDLSTFYMFPNIFKYGGFLASWLIFMIIGFIGVIIITTEIQQKTLRQNIITGLSRQQYLLGKIGFCFTIAFFITLYFLLWALLLGFMNTETIYLSKVMEGMPILLGLFLQCLAYLFFGMLIGFFVKRTGVALFLFFDYPLIEIFLRYGIHARYFQGPGIKYYPFNVFEDLVPLPFANMIQSLSEDFSFDILIPQNSAIIATLLYMVILLGVTYFKLNRDDL